MQAHAQVSVAENISTVSSSGMSWLITLKDPETLWIDNWISLVVEFGVFGLFLHACHHATRRGERAIYLLVTLMISGTFIELLQQIPHSGYQLWWYHETTVNVFHHKVPFYILCLFSVIYYYVDCMTKNINLPLMTKSFATGSGAMLVTYPLLVLAPNFLLMIVHFDDPVFRDRILNVPYSELSYLFLLFFHVGQLYNSLFEEIEPQEKNSIRFFRCSLQSGLVAAAYSLVEFYLLYVVSKLILHLNSIFCILGSLVILGFIVKDEISEKVQSIAWNDFYSILTRPEWKYLVSFLLLISLLPLFVHPENLRSNGERLELGPCGEIHSVSNMSPLDIFRRRYVCPNDTKRFGFDFHCVPEKELSTRSIKKQYTICGTPFTNATRLSEILLWYSAATIGYFGFLFSLKVTMSASASPTKIKKID